MLKGRVDALADGIFAIVMTLLVIEIRVPELHGAVTNGELWHELAEISPLFLSYILSFIVLSTTWMAHNFIISRFAKNLNRQLTYLNLIFLMVVALIPFSSHFLGTYHYTQIGIGVYGANVAAISLLVGILLHYTRTSPHIENDHSFLEERDLHYAYIRISMPLAAAIIAFGISFVNTTIPIYLFVFVSLFNFVPGTLKTVDTVLGKVLGKRYMSEAEALKPENESV